MAQLEARVVTRPRTSSLSSTRDDAWLLGTIVAKGEANELGPRAEGVTAVVAACRGSETAYALKA